MADPCLANTAELGTRAGYRGGNQGLGTGREGRSGVEAEARTWKTLGCAGGLKNLLTQVVAV